jgi:hypothetical protein
LPTSLLSHSVDSLLRELTAMHGKLLVMINSDPYISTFNCYRQKSEKFNILLQHLTLVPTAESGK